MAGNVRKDVMAEQESLMPFPARDAGAGSMPAVPGRRPVITSAQLERIYSSFFSPIYGFIYSRVGNREDAEDLTSHVFMKSLQYLDPSAAPQEIEAYLFRIARSDLADHWRRYAALRVVPIDEERESYPAADEEDADVPSLPSLAGELERILAILPPNYRRVLELRFYEGRTIKETARAMHVTEANAKVLQYRAVKRAAAYARSKEEAQ
ncbi:MAG: RNA polymerase sigma factor [Dehalococcoidia bacterium]